MGTLFGRLRQEHQCKSEDNLASTASTKPTRANDKTLLLTNCMNRYTEVQGGEPFPFSPSHSC